MKLTVDVPDMREDELPSLTGATEHNTMMHRALLEWVVPIEDQRSRIHRYRVTSAASSSEIAEAIADMIRHETTGLDNEDKAAVTPGWASHARAKKWRDQDRAKINGYRIALSYVLGCPLDFHKTDAFISNEPYWEAL
jgi:hypothetical protein